MPDGSASPLLLGGRYELGPLLGIGTSARVHRAHDLLLDRPVAIKLFRRDVAASEVPASGVAEPDVVTAPKVAAVPAAQVQAEGRALAALAHPNVVQVHDCVAVDTESSWSLAYLVMEFVDGPTLASYCAQGPIHPARLAQIGAQLGAALAHVHAHGIVHRDVKPANVLIDSSGLVRLVDFGVMRLLDQADPGRPALTGLTVGTAPYLSPEQIRQHDVGPPTDVYALGLVLLEGLTGRREYTGDPVACALARLTRPPVIAPWLPGPWPTLLTAMTAAQPADRPTALAVSTALSSPA